jgi:hypothetical protein
VLTVIEYKNRQQGAPITNPQILIGVFLFSLFASLVSRGQGAFYTLGSIDITIARFVGAASVATVASWPMTH